MPQWCAIWARVSTDDQDASNQLAELRQWAGRRGLEVATEYVLDGASAWKGEHREQLAQALADARTGRYDLLLVWALDRLSREGVEATLGLLRGFHAAGAPVWVAARAVDRDRRHRDGRAADVDLRVDGPRRVCPPLRADPGRAGAEAP